MKKLILTQRVRGKDKAKPIKPHEFKSVNHKFARHLTDEEFKIFEDMIDSLTKLEGRPGCFKCLDAVAKFFGYRIA